MFLRYWLFIRVVRPDCSFDCLVLAFAQKMDKRWHSFTLIRQSVTATKRNVPADKVIVAMRELAMLKHHLGDLLEWRICYYLTYGENKKEEADGINEYASKILHFTMQR